MRVDLSADVAHLMATIWHEHKVPSFTDYIACTYKMHVERTPSFDRIYIAEAEFGDVETASIGGIIRRWWMMDDAGLTQIARPALPAPDDRLAFDPCPILKFFLDGTRVVLGERLGPDMICRKTATIIMRDGSVRLDNVRVAWKAGSCCGDLNAH